jgi:hypothetical protein
MRCTLDLLIPVSRAYRFTDFCGDRVNCFNTIVEETGLLLCEASRVFACEHLAL